MAKSFNDRRNGRTISKHHVIPRSRGGAENGDNGGHNTVKVARRWHDAWHMTFGNLTPKEAKKFIDIVFSKKGRQKEWTVQKLYTLQLDLQQQTEAASKHKKRKKEKS